MLYVPAHSLIPQALKQNNEMMRFIPTNILENTLHKEKFVDFLANETKSLLIHIRQSSSDDFML